MPGMKEKQMMRKKQTLFFGILGLVLLMVGLQADFLTAGPATGQYLVNRHGGCNECGEGDGRAARQLKFVNPSSVEMFALWIKYDLERDFGSCEGRVLGAGDNTFGAGGQSAPCCVDDRSYNEVISVPTEGRLKGLINPTVGIEVWRGSRSYLFTPATPTLFKASPDVVSCACSELNGLGLPMTLLARFGIRCP